LKFTTGKLANEALNIRLINFRFENFVFYDHNFLEFSRKETSIHIENFFLTRCIFKEAKLLGETFSGNDGIKFVFYIKNIQLIENVFLNSYLFDRP